MLQCTKGDETAAFQKEKKNEILIKRKHSSKIKNKERKETKKLIEHNIKTFNST